MIVFCFGTRPEVIKISPLIKRCIKQSRPFKTIFTGQHKELFDDVKNMIPPVDYNLNIMSSHQSLNDILLGVTQHLPAILKKEKADLVIIQGDTTTVLATALVCFNEKIPIGHVEAGLRTYDLLNPYPEEGNRQIVSKIANYNWAPTTLAAENLERENVSNILLTGNTIVDACLDFNFPISYQNKVLITLHRRENFGDRMRELFQQVNSLAQQNSNTEFIFPMHPNPHVQAHRDILTDVNIIEPLPYTKMIKLLSEVKWVISNSGGIQEECATFRKKVLICRTTTERMEGVHAGFAKLAAKNILEHLPWLESEQQWKGINPYGNGTASEKILNSLA